MGFSIEQVREAVLSDMGIEEDEPGYTLVVSVHSATAGTFLAWEYDYTDGSGTHDFGLALWRPEIGEFEFTTSPGSSSYDSTDYEPTWEQNDAEWRAEQARGGTFGDDVAWGRLMSE